MVSKKMAVPTSYQKAMFNLYDGYKANLYAKKTYEPAIDETIEENISITEASNRTATEPLIESVSIKEDESLFIPISPSKEDEFLLNMKFIAKNRVDFKALLDSNDLGSLNPAIFDFLSEEQKKKTKEQLHYRFYLLYAQYQLDLAEGRRYAYKQHKEAINRCAELLERINLAIDKSHSPFRYQLLIEETFTEKYLKYLGFCFIGKVFVEAIQDFLDSPTRTTKKWMSDVNGLRLEWVWESGLLRAVLDLWPASWFNKAQTGGSLNAVSPYTGYMSFVLYYFRFAIELFALLKHTTNALWWKSAAEEEIPMKERFLTQWNQRKFALLNDLIWATANLVCFFYLVGNGLLGYMGNVVTAGLLLMDLCLLIWKYLEAKTKHNKTIKEWENEIKALYETQNDANRDEIKKKVADLEKMITKKQFEWKYENKSLVKDIMYAAGLLAAFALMCCFFFPPSAILPATALIIAAVGAALCFIVTVANSARENYLDYKKMKESHGLIDKTLSDNLTELKALSAKITDWEATLNDLANPLSAHEKLKIEGEIELASNRQKIIYLEMKDLVVDSEQQQQSLSLQKVKMARNLIIDILIPTTVFCALMFAPLNIGLLAIGGLLALIAVTCLIVKYFEPNLDKAPHFDNTNFNDFIESIGQPESEVKMLLKDIVHEEIPRNSELAAQSLFHKTLTPKTSPTPIEDDELGAHLD